MNRNQRNLIIFAIFLVLTLVMTFPLLLNFHNGVRDPGDPLLNSWVLAWNVHKIISLDFRNYFDANIFYPYERTLAYSEHLFTQSLLALPILLASGNPILAHNVVLFLAFVTSAFGMYLFAYDLTKNAMSSIVAGMIYAFSPFMFAHLAQVQVLCAGGIPLTFLFLHRFFNTESYKDLLLFTLFFLLQVLANGYYALFLTLFVGLFIVSYAIAKRKLDCSRFWLKLGVFVTLVIAFAGPFYYQYIRVRHEIGFSRQIGSSASLVNFMATARINRIYGKVTRFAWQSEGELFPGLVALLLALLGLLLGLHVKIRRVHDQRAKLDKFLFMAKMALNALIFFCLVIIAILIFAKGFEFSIGNLPAIRAHHLLNPILTLLFLLVLRVVIAKVFKNKMARFQVQGEKPLLIYTAVLLVSFLLTFGEKGPYIFLYKYVPGFDGLRAVARFHIFVMFSLAILAAYGVRSIWARLRRPMRCLFALLIPVLILAEYFSAPIPLRKMPVRGQIPEVYRWLASHKGKDFAVLELPLPGQRGPIASMECPRMYYSTYHWKKLVNGYSGYFSPLYNEIRRRWPKLPLELMIKDLKGLNVKYVIFHSSPGGKEDQNETLEGLYRLDTDLRFVDRFGDSYVFEFVNPLREPERVLFPAKRQAISLRGSEVDSNVNGDRTLRAVDGSMETRWQAGPQRKGQYFEVDLSAIDTIGGVSLKLGRYHEAYPRNYLLEVSLDKISWTEVAEQKNARLPLTAFLKPKDLSLDIFFPPTAARYIKITNTGENPALRWSICEIGVFK